MVGRRIRNFPRRVKWWFQRANGEVTPDQWWDFKYSLAYFIEKGLDGLLHEGVTDWDAPYHKQEKKDLEFVLQWAKDFPKYEAGWVARDKQDFILSSKQMPDVFIYTKEEADEFEKRTKKALTLLAKHIHFLWD